MKYVQRDGQLAMMEITVEEAKALEEKYLASKPTADDSAAFADMDERETSVFAFGAPDIADRYVARVERKWRKLK